MSSSTQIPPTTADLPADVSGFCAGGKPPVAFTFGTCMMHADELFRGCVEACQMLGLRGVLVTRFRSQLPAELPPWAVHCGFAPFQKLFPLCAAVVHHGGVGTTAKALAAGVPQVILPFAFDQMDNAQRVERLGAGTWHKSGRRRASDLAKAIAAATTPQMARQASGVASRFHGSDGLESASDVLEQAWREKPD